MIGYQVMRHNQFVFACSVVSLVGAVIPAVPLVRFMSWLKDFPEITIVVLLIAGIVEGVVVGRTAKLASLRWCLLIMALLGGFGCVVAAWCGLKIGESISGELGYSTELVGFCVGPYVLVAASWLGLAALRLLRHGAERKRFILRELMFFVTFLLLAYGLLAAVIGDAVREMRIHWVERVYVDELRNCGAEVLPRQGGGWAVHWPTGTKDADLKNNLGSLGRLTKLHLDLEGTMVTDETFDQLCDAQNITGLFLEGTDISNAGIKSAARLEKLEVLRLSCGQINEAGLRHLVGCKALSSLHLICSSNQGHTFELSDGLVSAILVIETLEVLQLPNHVDETIVKKLRKQFPNIRIYN